MSVSGRVTSVTPDWRGDTLKTTTTAVDVVLAVEDATDFDEDGGWLVIADSDPIAYTGVDDDAETVTLASSVGAVYEAGLPVIEWDPTVPPEGAQVVEYLASVDVGHGVTTALVPHVVVPAAGVDNLIGASVTIEEDDEDGGWYVDQVLGREPTLDQAFIGAPLISLYQASNVLWSSSTSYAPLTDWTVKKQIGVDFDPVNGSAVFTQEGLGRYLVVVVVNWDGNSSGLRKARLVSTIDGTDEVLRFITGSPPDAQAYVQQMVVGDFDAVVAGQELRVDAFQSSGAALNMQGNAPGTQTVFSLTRLQA